MGFTALWIKTSINLPRHPKIEKLAELLEISRADAVGRLVMIWIYALEFRTDGKFNSADEIARAADWPREDAEKFVNALIYCGGIKPGFIEFPRAENEFFYLHDWEEYSGGNALQERRGRRTEKDYKKEEKKAAQENAADDLNAALRIVPKDANHAAFLKSLGML